MCLIPYIITYIKSIITLMQALIKKCIQLAILKGIMFKRPTKKQLLVRRIITLVVMVIAVLVIVTGTILFILGYRLDGDKGRLEQNALVQFDSVPNGANVTIDGKAVSARTPLKQSVIAGAHNFTVTRDQYQPWNKSLTTKAGTLSWLDYIRLVPKKLETESVAKYTTVFGEKASPDSKWLMVQEKADTAAFQLVDLRAQQIKTSEVTIPAALITEAATASVAHTYTMESWDENGRYLLVKHIYADKSEYIVVDTQDVATSINVSRSLGINLTDVEFSGTSGNILYGLSDGTVRKLDLSNATISRALVSNVTSFNVYKENIVTYVGTDVENPAWQVAGVYRDGDENAHVLRTIKTAGTPVSIDATRYYNDDFVAIAEGTKVTILKGNYPASNSTDVSSLKTYAEFSAAGNVDTLTFSNEGNFLVAQSGLAFVGYEIEYMRFTNAMVTTSETQAHTLNWLDDAYLYAVYDGHLSIREFDGANVHVIMPMEPGFDATLSQNGRYLYGIAKSGDTYQLQRVRMILE